MHAMPFALACCAFFMSFTVIAEARAEAVKVTPELTVFTEEQISPADGRPTVLRGSATKRGTVDSRYGGGYEPARFQLGAGAKLWLTDPVSGEVMVCDERRTSRVGSRFIGCLRDQLPYGAYE